MIPLDNVSTYDFGTNPLGLLVIVGELNVAAYMLPVPKVKLLEVNVVAFNVVAFNVVAFNVPPVKESTYKLLTFKSLKEPEYPVKLIATK